MDCHCARLVASLAVGGMPKDIKGGAKRRMHTAGTPVRNKANQTSWDECSIKSSMFGNVGGFSVRPYKFMASSFLETKLLKERIQLLWSRGLAGHEIWKDFCDFCGAFASRPAHSLTELCEIRRKSTKIKGDLFEAFAKLYLTNVYGLTGVWSIGDLPPHHCQALNLTPKDMGIDLVGHKDSQWYAVQVKYRSRPSSKYGTTKRIVIPWKDLSTFYALAARSGPFVKHIVFTSADSVRRVGKRTPKDETIGHTALKNLTRDHWCAMCEAAKKKVEPAEPTLVDPSYTNDRPSPDSLRAKRIAFFLK